MRRERIVFSLFLALGIVIWAAATLGNMAFLPRDAAFDFLSGHEVKIHLFGLMVFLATGIIAFILLHREDAARAQAAHLKKILSVLRGVNQLITRLGDRDTLLQRVCEIIVESGVYPAAVIMLPAANGGRREFDAGLAARFLSLRDIIARGEDPLCYRRVMGRSAAMTVDHTDNPLCCARGFGSRESVCAGIRLEYEDTVYGTLMLPSVSGFVSAEEESLLTELAGDIALALHTMEAREKRLTAERKATETEDRYRLLFEQSRDAISITTEEGRFLEVNKAFLDLFGFTREELAEKNAVEVYADSADRGGLLALLCKQGYSGDRELFFTRKDGTQFPAIINVTLLRDSSDSVIGLQSAIHDTSSYRKMVEEMKQYQRAVESSEDCIACLDRDYRFIFANEAYLALRNMKREDMVGHTFEEIAGKEFFETELKGHFDRCLAGETARFTVEHEYPAGWRSMDVGYYPLRDEQGGVTGVVSVHRDVTSVRHAEDRYRLLFEQSRDAITVTTPDGNILNANPAWHILFGYSPDDLPDMTMGELYANSEERDRLLGMLETQGTVLEYPLMTRRKDGTVFPAILNVTVFRDAENRPHWYQSSLRDVSREKAFVAMLEQYRRAVESSEDCISCMDRDYQFVFANEAYLALRKTTLEEIIGKTLAEVADEEFFRENLKDNFDRCLTGETVRFIVEREYPAGWRSMDVGYYPLRDEDDAVIGVVSLHRDVTAVREAERALLMERDKLRSILDSLRDAIYMIDGDYTIQYANPALERDFGPVLGWKCHECLSGCDEPCSDCLLEGVFAGNVVTREWFANKSGKHYAVSKMPVRNADGSILALAVMQDITARKRAEAEIRDMAKFPLEDPWPVMRIDYDGTLLFVNPAGDRAFGDTLNPVGEPVPEFWVKMMNTVREAGEARDVEFEAGDRAFLATVIPVGGADYVNVYMSDITLRRELQLQYLQAQKMESVARLAGGVAHDFNNLLTAILGYADMAASGVQEGCTAYDDVREIRRIALRAADLTRQLLAFSRRQIITPRVLSLNDVLLDMDKMLRRLIGEDVELVTLTDPDLLPVRMDSGQLEQVLTNLVVNARDAMPDGGKLTIETTVVHLDAGYAARHDAVNPGEYVMLAVCDTGTGMPEEVRAHAFEPFFTTKEHGKGTGLGLATVYGIVKQNGGHIWLYSEPGQGTVFKIYFPAVRESVKRMSADVPETVPGGKETILFVEDESAVLAMTARTLRDLGYTVLEASNGEEGLRVAEAHDGGIDLLLTDVVMPRMGGKELSDRLSPRRPGLKTLFISGYTDNSIVHHGVLATGIAFLQKPFSKDGLARKIREVLGG